MRQPAPTIGLRPGVTVGIPVHNGMPFLADAVESVLTQSLQQFSLLLIDDGSTDESATYLATLKDARVTVLRQENAGLGATLNRMIALCETEYFARMDADDLCDRERLAAQMRFLSEHPDVVMLGTQIRFLAGPEPVHAGYKPTSHEWITQWLSIGKFGFCHPTVIFKTEVARRIGGYRVEGAGEDLDFFLRMSEAGRVANLDQVLFSYRVHDKSLATSRYSELQLGYAYAMAAARCRRAGMEEPRLEEFRARWERRGPVKKLLEKLDCIAEGHYRSAVVALSSKRRCYGAMHLLATSLLRPGGVLRRLASLPGLRRRSTQASGESHARE